MSLTTTQERMNIIAKKYGLPKVFNEDDSINHFWQIDFRQMLHIDYFEQLCILKSYKR
jgi:hypothetical protein